jgi:alanyl-tRNA synthetase
MRSSEVRSKFLEFFSRKQHLIVASAPMVIKNDPTLMFTNAGMNQFKDIFLGIKPATSTRIADTQKCLRVSGKHNDLEEVGHDTYHHTMFEMLGNWSFGDYFKKDAIDWAWELLTEVYGIRKEDLYVSVFGGDKGDGLEPDQEAQDLWSAHVNPDRILHGSRKDNFWEMGDTGPCGPCSEIHVDLRSEELKAAKPGRELVNEGHPEVIEIWNLVFIQYNRKADGSLEQLPAKHVDTGMGFERLCRVLQGKTSNYDTDIFLPIITELASIAGIGYGKDEKSDIAMRVVADHLRAVSFAIADGQLPSNVKAGYVIRRILRRAVRYGYTFLNFREPFIHKLVPVLAFEMGTFFPELNRNLDIIRKVIQEEELAFLRTLETGIRLLDGQIAEARKKNSDLISGEQAFLLYDTYGFPFDLTQLILAEQGLKADVDGFEQALLLQKERSRKASATETGDWVVLAGQSETQFVGYDSLEAECRILKYRMVTAKNKSLFQLVLDQTPFYPESGGQVGDRGYLSDGSREYQVIDTQKEHNLIIHLCPELPADCEQIFTAHVNAENRISTACNHSATHLLHHALRQALGTHVEQKGSLVHPDYLRFDFSHFQKMSDEEVEKVERMVNRQIRLNHPADENRMMETDRAIALGAMSLFGEKYGDKVRVIRFGDSMELCGGTHVEATGNIGLFRIISEGAIAAGVRRIEAITGEKAEDLARSQAQLIEELKVLLRNPGDPLKGAHTLLLQNASLEKEIEILNRDKVKVWADGLIQSASLSGNSEFVSTRIQADAALAKDLAYEVRKNLPDAVIIIGNEHDGKAGLTLMLSESLVKDKGMHAGNLIRELAKEIKGGGGGQAHFASAGGQDPSGIDRAIERAKQMFI